MDMTDHDLRCRRSTKSRGYIAEGCPTIRGLLFRLDDSCSLFEKEPTGLETAVELTEFAESSIGIVGHVAVHGVTDVVVQVSDSAGSTGDAGHDHLRHGTSTL